MTLKTLRLQLLLAAIIFCINFNAQVKETAVDKPIYNSLLWEITGNGIDQPSYLYGTMHVSQKLAFHLGDPFFKAIESCDMVALELNPESWMKDLAESDLLQEPYSPYASYNNFYEDAFKIPFPKNRDLGFHIAAEDNLINGLLYRSNNYAVDFEEETYLDLYIFQTGRRMGKEVFSLENYEEVMDFSRKAMLPSDDDEEVNYRKMKDLFKDTSPQEVLQDSYRKGDLNLVDSVSRMMNPSKNFHKYMIVERNIGMANNMDSIIQAGSSLFTGVGAAHLPGSYGVIELLREKGYELNAIEKGIGGKSKVYQDKYDDLIVPFTYSKQEFNGEFYTLEAPGEMYSMPSSGNLETYLHPNMANGAYYWVKRIKTYDKLLKRDVAYTKQRIDSLLYENIPGEILSKKDISNNGVIGFDIINETRQGDKQRYHIYATPLEILIFKMGGTKEFATKQGGQFFESISINIPLEGEIEKVSPPEKGFSVDLPAYHLLYRLRNGASSGGPGLEYQAVDANGDYYLVRKTVLNDDDYIEEDKYELKQFVKSIALDDRFTTKMRELTTYQGYPSMNVSFEVAGLEEMLHAKLVIKGPEYFFLGKLTDEKFAACESYFNSLAFSDFEYKNEFEELVDSTFGFKTKTVKMSKVEEIRMETMNMYVRNNEKENEVDDMAYLTYDRKINSSKTGEEVLVSMERYNAFSERENIDSLWSSRLRNVEDYGSFRTERVKKSVNDSIYTLEYLLVDTGSTRGIMVKNILSNRKMYSLQATIDTLTEPSVFVKSTFENFQILPDTVKQNNLFEDKSDLFFECMLSEDSATVARAFEYMNVVDFKAEDEPRLEKILNNFNFEHQEMEDRAALIEIYDQFKSKSAVAFLRNEYLKNEDTVTYQLACLSALSSMETIESRKVLRELMVNYPTIPSENSELSKVYNPLFDSLEISKTLFPDFMELSTFVEYKKNNLNLMSSLIYNKAMKAKVLKKYKRQLINEALIELKRQFAAEEGSDTKKNTNWNMRNKMTRLNYDLIDYAIIIAPWYKEEKVQKFFKDIKRLKNKRTLTQLVCVMKSANVPVSSEFISEISADPKSSAFFLENLREYEIEGVFDEKYLNPDKMSYSILVSQYDFENDSTDVEFIGKYLIESKDDPGYYYFYKAKQKNHYEDEYNWAIYFNGPQPEDGSEVFAEGRVSEKSENIEPDEDIEELLKEIKLELEMKGRERFGSKYERGYYDEYGY